MALSGNQKAYLQARSGIARSGAIRSNYVFPLYGVLTVNGIDFTKYVQYGTLHVTLAINEQPDTAAFDVLLTDSTVAANLVVGADVVIALGGRGVNLVFGGHILTVQTTCQPGHVPRRCSVLCADYLQVLDSEYLITYDWPPQSATVTIRNLIARFANRPGSLPISPSLVAAGLPSHATVAFANERFSTVLRRLVTMFPAGGGFYVDPDQILHVWTGASEPDMLNPQPLTLTNPTLKAFARTVDGAQQRDAAIVEGMRTTAPLGTPGPDPADVTGRLLESVPVGDASILDKVTDAGVDREVRIGTQRFLFRIANGVWSAPVGTSQTTIVTADVAFDPAAGGPVTIPVESTVLLTGRTKPWVQIDEQILRVLSSTATSLTVPRTGYGAMVGALKAAAVVTVIDSLATGVVTGRYDAENDPEKVRPQPIDSDVVMVARSTTGVAIHEQFVQDGRFSRAGATARGTREVLDFKDPVPSIEFETEDLNAKPGRLQVYALTDPVVGTLAGEAMILTAELTWPVWGQPPRRVCHAAIVQAADVVDAWLVDPR